MKRTMHIGADHPHTQDRRAADRLRHVLYRRLPCHRGDVADISPLRQQYGGMQAEEATRLTQLDKENARLKKLLAEAELEKAML